MTRPQFSSDGKTLTVSIPMSFAQRGGRKLVIAPQGASPFISTRPRIDNTLIKALARAHRWKRMLEAGEYDSVVELAKAEQINESYVSRILRLTLFAPDIVEAILDGRQPAGLQAADLMRPFSVEWAAQRRFLGLDAK